MEPIRIISSIQSPILLASTYYFREKKLLKIKAWKLLQKIIKISCNSFILYSFIHLISQDTSDNFKGPKTILVVA